jgi:heme/copper-type cytochrome/quinol oxidase subunit 2
MKNYLKIPLLAIAIVIVGFVFVFSATNILAQNGGSYAGAGKNQNGATQTALSPANSGSTGSAAVGSNDVQIVNMKVVGSQYIMTPNVVKKGIPVRIVADMSAMPSCSKAFTIPDFGVQKYFTASDNTVEFTPNKAGTFKVACTMNMYRGTFAVTDDGTADAATTAAIAKQNAASASSPAGTCGMGAGGGGCGCGG